MKKLIFIITCLLVMIPTIISAHTDLTSSNPEAGQVLTEDLTEIILSYAGEIESLSTMKLMKDGQEIPLSVELQEKQMIGTISTLLDNGSYVIEWSIAGEDGHPITGEIPFSVQKEQVVEQEPKTETKEPVTTEKEDSKADTQNQDDNNNEQNNKPSSNMMKLILPLVVVLILGIGLFLLFGRKK
ncbi:copper resistance CopC family protein [Neobacillus niacini]|uniref:copper resistance CopC family protein n=1 Tax=Neobacillus niacini TaxID=86668 RepID=UPI002FFEC753